MPQLIARAMEPALDRADLATADLGHLVVAEAVDTDKDEYLAVWPADLLESAPEGRTSSSASCGAGQDHVSAC